MFNSEQNQTKKRKVQVILNEKFIEAFEELTKNDAANIQSYQNMRTEKITNQQDLMDEQAKKRQEVIDADNKKPASTFYETLWAGLQPGTKMEKKGRGNYARDALKSKTRNYDVSRHVKQESKRLKHRGKKYMMMGTYTIQRAKEVRMFITCNVMLFYLNFFNINIK